MRYAKRNPKLGNTVKNRIYTVWGVVREGDKKPKRTCSRAYYLKFHRHRHTPYAKLMKEYRKKHKAELKEYAKQYQQTHKEQIKTYYKTPKGIAVGVKYRQSQKGIKTIARKCAERKNFGFVPLNNYFDGSNGHHIDKQFVIYIPKEMHVYNRHSVLRDKGMDVINELAFNWLEAEELYANYVR